MHRSFRFAACVTGTLLATLIVATSGFVNAGASAAEMPGMGMSNIHAERHGAPAVVTVAVERSKGGQPPCKKPCGEDVCASMVGCAAAAVTQPQTEAHRAEPMSSMVVASAILEPKSESPAPELPPPRA